MKFEQLSVKNFLTIEQATVALNDRGLHLIQGANEDDGSASSNGAGKSSLVDAICWVLYGTTARDVKGDAVVNLAAKKECRVELVMSNGATKYRVVRHRKHSVGKNAVHIGVLNPDLSVTDLSRGTDAETQKVIEKTLGCSREVFMAAVYSGQEVMPDLPRMKDRELKTLIEEAAGLQRIERAYEVARERLSEAKSTLSAAETRLSGARARAVTAEKDLDEVRSLHKQWGDTRADRIAEATAKCSEIGSELKKGIARVSELQPARDAAVKRTAEIDELLANHRSLDAAAQAAEVVARRAEAAIDAKSIGQTKDQIELYKRQIADPDSEIVKPCPECGTKLTSMSREEYIAHRQKHLSAAEDKLRALTQKALEQKQELDKLRAEATRLRGLVPDVSALIEERAGLAPAISSYDSAKASLAELAAKGKAADLERQARKTEPNPHDKVVELSEARLKASISELAVADANVVGARRAEQLATSVVRVFGPAGVRAQILDTVTPFLNARTSDYLSVLSDGEITATWTTLTKSASGDLKEKFSIEVTHAKGGESFSALSGGEKRKVRLACALALQDLVASRATQPLDLWVGDEIDDALDPAGLERLMTILERKARERGTVLVISHSDLRDWVDNVTVVRKYGQWKSKVEGSLCL